MKKELSRNYEKLNIRTCRAMVVISLIGFIFFERLFGIGMGEYGAIVLFLERGLIVFFAFLVLLSVVEKIKPYYESLLGLASILCILWLEFYAFTTHFDYDIAYFALFAIIVSMTFHQNLFIISTIFLSGLVSTISLVLLTEAPIVNVQMYLFVSILFMLLNYIAVFRNYQNRKDSYMALYVDGLTKIPNKKAAQEAYREMMGKKTELKSGIMLLDIDDFKKINVLYGQEYGDLVLKKIARLASGAMRDSDFIFKSNGDEFIILFSDVESLDKVTAIADRVIEDLERAFRPELDLRFSCGIALIDRDLLPFHVNMSKANDAVQKAKTQKKRKVVIL